MVTLNKIYTRTGDDGSTGLVGGARVKKDSRKVSAYGDIDEANSHIGACRTMAESGGLADINDILTTIQNELFDLGAELATPADASWEGMPQTKLESVRQLELWIDDLNSGLPDLKSFILPGGTPLNAHLHIARVVCRRAERSVITLSEDEPVSAVIVQYIDRLSDLLFVMARSVAARAGVPEYLWVPGASRPKQGPTL